MTGEYAAFGQRMRAGAEQAVADINKAGGVLGQQLALEVGDDACDPKQAVSVANDLASKGVKLVSRLKQAGIDVIYVGGYHTEAGLILRQAREQGMKATLVGGDALVTNEFWQIAGEAGNGTLMPFASDPRRRPTAAAVVKAFKDKGIDPEGYVLYTYAAVQVWAQAAQKANSTDPKKVAAAMHTGTWQTVLGPITFDKKGDVTVSDYVFYIWANGSYAEM